MAMTRKSVKEIRDGAIKVLNEYMKQFGYEESGTGTTYSNDGSKISFKFDFLMEYPGFSIYGSREFYWI